MIVTSDRPLSVGAVYRPGMDGLIGICDCDGVEQREFCLQVLRESSRAEYLEYWEAQGAKRHHLCTDEYFYLVSMD